MINPSDKELAKLQSLLQEILIHYVDNSANTGDARESN